METKEQLLQQLYKLGVHESGRRVRSDKNQMRGPNSHMRSDIGSVRSTRGVPQEPLTVYAKIRSRVLANSVNSQYVIQPDINHIYMPAKRESRVEHGKWTIIHRGQKIFRTVRHIKGYQIDLEKFRFNGIQSKILHGEIMAHQRPMFHNELTVFPQVKTWLELFCSLYHVREEDALKWSYSRWWSHYIIVCDDELSPDFKFSLIYSPGTPEFAPEYADKVLALKQEKVQEVISSKAYENERARIRDLLIAKESERIKVDVLSLPGSEQYSMLQLDKIVRQQIDTVLIDKQIDEHMNKWLEDKIIFDNN